MSRYLSIDDKRIEFTATGRIEASLASNYYFLDKLSIAVHQCSNGILSAAFLTNIPSVIS